jgi:diguanylate cyclase (GGDEF)-like protein/PAS domain S-box-containing protein
MKHSRGAGAANRPSGAAGHGASGASPRHPRPPDRASRSSRAAPSVVSETRIRVPAVRPLRETAEPARSYSERSPARSILIVERETAVAEDIEASLLRFGYDVAATAVSASDALLAVETHQPDLVLVDVRLDEPGDGIAVGAAIRARSATPVVFLASQSDDATLMRAKEEAQPHGFLLRPYHDGELRAAVEVALQHHKLEQELRQQRSLLAGVVSGMSDAVITADAEGHIVLMNEAGRRAFGDAVRGGKHTSALVLLPDHETPCPSEEMPLARALRGAIVRDQELFICSPMDPEGRWYSVNATPLLDTAGDVCGAVAVGRDVTDLRAARSELQELARTDALTGAYNRLGFMQVAREALLSAHQRGTRPAVFFIDLDGMKRINDSLGHSQGDRLLVDLASILRTCFRTSDIVGRIGGDEFVVLAPEAGENIEPLRARLRTAIASFNAHAERPYRISVSVGFGTSEPGQYAGLEELVAQADRRMYEEKLVGGVAREA